MTRVSCRVQSALRLKPTFTDAYNNLASALVQKGMVPAALQCYQAALQINPHLVNSLIQSLLQWSQLVNWWLDGCLWII